jgi:hypothetical protein
MSSKSFKLFISVLILAVCINSGAADFLQVFKKGNYKVDFTPLQIGVIGNLFDTDNVYGFSFALPVSSNKNNYGIAAGIWGKSKIHYGMQCNVINLADELGGVQIGLFGIIKEADGSNIESSGFQWNLFSNTSEALFGFQSGFVNQSGRLNGGQLGLVNISDQGLQLGMVNVFNSPKIGKGFDSYQTDARIQIGIYNHSSNSAFQFGVINYNKNSLIPVFPLFNFSLN